MENLILAPRLSWEEWLVARRKRVGASEVAAILGVSPWATPWDLWADKTERLEGRWHGNSATHLGTRLESAVLDMASEALGVNLIRGESILHPTAPIASTLDARVEDTLTPVEAKTAGIVGWAGSEWGEEGTDIIPDHYLVQVHTQIACTGAELGYLFALIGGRGVVRYEVHRSEQFTNMLVDTVSEWWQRHVVKDEEPSRDCITMEVVKRLRKEAAKSVILSDDDLVDVAEWQRLKDAKSATEKLLDIETAKLLAALGDAESGKLPDGREVTYFETKRKGYVVSDTSYRTLRTRKTK